MPYQPHQSEDVALKTAGDLRRLASGRDEWRVADPITGSHCIEFGKGNKAERQARAWLRNLRATIPGHRFANYVVTKVHTFSDLEKAARAAADLLDGGTGVSAQVEGK